MLNNIKKNLVKIIISSVVILVPMLFGIIVYDQLPEEIAIHWNILGEVDAYGPTNVIVFVIPIVMLAIHLSLIPISYLIDKERVQSDKIISLSLAIIPIITLFVSLGLYLTAFGYGMSMISIIPILFSLIFILVGNYMPKAVRNNSFGIKTRWTLANEANWNATHRFAGKVWVATGVLILFAALLPVVPMMITVLCLTVIGTASSILYSYVFYKRDIKEGRATEEDYKLEKSKFPTLLLVLIIGSVAAFLFVIMFTGDINVEYGDTEFTVKSTYFDSVSLEYSVIDSIELRPVEERGVKVFGFDSARLLLGTFSNDEFGNYSIYSYNATRVHVVIKVDDRVMVIGGIDDKTTAEIYHNILERIPE